MPLADGEPARAGDTWLRVITNKKYLKADGTLTNNAFGGKAISPPSIERPWSYEISGALRSLIDDLKAYAENFCGERFEGFMYQRVEKLRSEEPHTDVIFTPRRGDPAHADLVVYNLDDKFAFRDWMQENILCVRANEVDKVDAISSS